MILNNTTIRVYYGELKNFGRAFGLCLGFSSFAGGAMQNFLMRIFFTN